MSSLKNSEPEPVHILSGWCIDGHHRPNAGTVGCKHEFPTFICTCPCHDPNNNDDPRYDSPQPPAIITDLMDDEPSTEN